MPSSAEEAAASQGASLAIEVSVDWLVAVFSSAIESGSLTRLRDVRMLINVIMPPNTCLSPGVTRHHNQGRWEARIGRVQGVKYLCELLFVRANNYQGLVLVCTVITVEHRPDLHRFGHF